MAHRVPRAVLATELEKTPIARAVEADGAGFFVPAPRTAATVTHLAPPAALPVRAGSTSPAATVRAIVATCAAAA